MEVGEDKKHGTLAVIHIRPAAGASAEEIRQKVREILARYTIKHEVVVE